MRHYELEFDDRTNTEIRHFEAQTDREALQIALALVPSHSHKIKIYVSIRTNYCRLVLWMDDPYHEETLEKAPAGADQPR